jgi:RND family efflux transporter MFP subunit
MFVLGAVFAGCGDEPPPPEVVARPVKMLEIGLGGVSGVREYPGTIRAAQQAELAFEVPGLIVELPVVAGQWVGRGRMLARLDARNYEAQRDADAASLEAARADYERYQELYAADAVTLQDLQLRQAQYDVAEARFRASQKALDDTRLLAPFEGRVARRYMENYQNVLAKEPVFLLNDDRRLEIVIAVPEADALLARRALDDPAAVRRVDAEATVSAFPDRRFPASLAEIATQADPVTRTFEVTFAFETPADIPLVPGMTARMVVRRTGGSGAAAVQRVPANAVFGADDGATSVWTVDPSSMTVARVPITVGTMIGSDVEIVGGLEDGDLIAITGVANLREGDPVRRMQD